MKGFIAVGAAAVGGVIAVRSLLQVRHRLTGTVGRHMLQRMERMMASLPEGAPPKLVMSVLPQLRDQNEQIIAMLRDQNELLREHLNTTRAFVARAS